VQAAAGLDVLMVDRVKLIADHLRENAASEVPQQRI
jgi:hypothetical protein